ncbi:hypothetical protein [Paraburkholderia sp. HD33-4]|uniref:hypothetical protein n=1 Tax=Paraburkholderia sp. HD33-4 TaxID=2883242 RepID=UPI001F4800DB|nr:hypothetical protein [Paraburkholderia sp. HD33-4]
MTNFFDFIYTARQAAADMDWNRGFFCFDVESLDAPQYVPAGSTESRTNFHITSFTFREY